MIQRFNRIAKEAFSFLEALGFRLVRPDAGHLRYESPSAVIVLNYDDRSGELEAFFGPPSSVSGLQELYSLTDVFGMIGVPGRETPNQAASPDRMKALVDRLATDVREYAHLALSGDLRFFRDLEAYRAAKAKALTEGFKPHSVRTSAEKAWQRRDMRTVVDLLSSIEDSLSPAERRMLEYARRQQAS